MRLYTAMNLYSLSSLTCSLAMENTPRNGGLVTAVGIVSPRAVNVRTYWYTEKWLIKVESYQGSRPHIKTDLIQVCQNG